MKPTVVFLHIENIPIVAGCPAIVFPLNHPKLGTQRVITSAVIEVKKDENIRGGVSEFETLNTRYVHLALPDADENVEIATSPNTLITSGEVDW